MSQGGDCTGREREGEKKRPASSCGFKENIVPEGKYSDGKNEMLYNHIQMLSNMWEGLCK